MRRGLALCLGIFVASVPGPVGPQTPAESPEERPALAAPAASPADSARQACEAGDAAQCVRLAALYRQGEAVPKDRAKAGELLRRACAAKYMEACFDLADMHWRGEVTGWVDDSEALDAFSEGVAIDAAKALGMHQVACDAGDARGCFILGNLYAEAVAQDEAKAAQLFEKACNGGDARGCFRLGEMYEDGQGVAEDDAKAAQLFEKACNGGDARGCCSLGFMYMGGLGVGRNETKAAHLRQKACDAGVAEGCVTLAMMYRFGDGVAQDEAKASQLLEKAAKATATEEPDEPLRPFRTIGVDGSEIAVVAFSRRPSDIYLVGLNLDGKLAVDRHLEVYSGQKDIKLANGGEVSVFWFNGGALMLYYVSRNGKTVLVKDNTNLSGGDLSTGSFEDLGKDVIQRIAFQGGWTMTVFDAVAYAKLLTAQGWGGKTVLAILMFLDEHLHIGVLDKDGNLAKGIRQVVTIYDSEKFVGGLFVSDHGHNLAQIGREFFVQDGDKLVNFKEIRASDSLQEMYLTPGSDAAAVADRLRKGESGELDIQDGRVVLVGSRRSRDGGGSKTGEPPRSAREQRRDCRRSGMPRRFAH